MIPAIVFREGHSGHYFASLVIGRGKPSFRMSDHFSVYCKDQIFLTHQVDYKKHIEEYNPVVRILPNKKIYNAIYNNFMKKVLVEDFPEFELPQWVNNTVEWYDRCYQNMCEFYNLIKQDIETNIYPEVVNFDLLTEEQYMDSVLKQYFGVELTPARITLLNEYKALQLNIDLEDNTDTSMEKIVEPLTNQMLVENPWFWAYCIFKYEHNNNINETQRLWTINNLQKPQTKNDLLVISRLYQK